MKSFKNLPMYKQALEIINKPDFKTPQSVDELIEASRTGSEVYNLACYISMLNNHVPGSLSDPRIIFLHKWFEIGIQIGEELAIENLGVHK